VGAREKRAREEDFDETPQKKRRRKGRKETRREGGKESRLYGGQRRGAVSIQHVEEEEGRECDLSKNLSCTSQLGSYSKNLKTGRQS
jgi:hypothetical protein